MNEYIQGRQNQTVYDELLGPDSDEDQRAGVDVVRKLISRTMDDKLSEVLDAQIGPLREAREAEEDAATAAFLEDKYPGQIKALGPQMDKIISSLPEEIQNSGSVEVMEAVLVRAMIDSGGFDDFAASKYQAKLEADKQKSTGAAPSNPNGSPVNAASNIKEAFEAAKRALGASL
jgi:hypothetical protein